MLRESIYKRYEPGVIAPNDVDERAWWFISCDNKLLVKINEKAADIPKTEIIEKLNIKILRKQYLGTLEGQQCYSAEAGPDIVLPEGMELRDLRSLYGLVDDDIFLLAGRAFQIVDWDRNHQYCGRCGTPTETKQDERAKMCPKCSLAFYPKLSPAIIVAVVRDGQLLLAHAKHFRPGLYSVIAGFVEPGETFEDCVKREVMEEVGIKVKNIKYFGSQPWPFPNSLMVAFTAEHEGGEIKVDGVEISDAGWYTSGNLPETPTKMSVSGQLIEWYIKNNS